MEITDLKQMTKEEVFNFIRQRLSFSKELQEQFRHVNKDDLAKEHRRFEMSGNESKTGQCTIFNTAILNEFADLGIYDYTFYSTSTKALQPFISNTSPKMKIWNIHLPDIPQRKSSLQFLNWLSSPESPKEIAAKKRIARKDNARSKDFYGFHLGTDFTIFTVPLD